jgi:uncharacterized protein YxjI
MALRRHRHDDSPAPLRFRMQEKLLSVGDDSWIEDEHGERVFHVDGKALRVRDTWILQDMHRTKVAEIKERKLSIRDKMTIDLGDRKATVTKRAVGVRDHFVVDVEHGDTLKVHGNIVDHEYEIESGHGTVASVSKRWFRVRDTYGVEVRPGADVVLLLAVTVAVDAITHGR